MRCGWIREGQDLWSLDLSGGKREGGRDPLTPPPLPRGGGCWYFPILPFPGVLATSGKRGGRKLCLRWGLAWGTLQCRREQTEGEGRV